MSDEGMHKVIITQKDKKTGYVISEKVEEFRSLYNAESRLVRVEWEQEGRDTVDIKHSVRLEKYEPKIVGKW